MRDSTDIKSVMSIDEDSNMVYGLFINREAAKWNFNKISFNYFQCDFNEFVNIFGSPRTAASRIQNLQNSFPMALRAVLENGSYIFERPPFQYTVHLSPKNARATSLNKNSRYISETVWIPWSFYHITPNPSSTHDQIPYSFSLYFSDKRITSHDHSFTIAPLPNVFGDGKVCLGDSGSYMHQKYLKMKGDIPIKDVFNLFINTFYSGGWNTDVLSYIPVMFDYQNFSLSKNQYDYDRLKEIHYTAKKSVQPVSHRDPYVRNYINSLRMWSQMSLENVLDSFTAQIQSGKNSIVYTSFDQLIPDTQYSYFENFISLNGNVTNSPSSFKLKHYWENPVDQSVVYGDTEMTEQDYYNILNNLIQYYKETPVSTSY